MKLKFTKMQALGNDFILLDNRDNKLRRIEKYARKLCDRRFGIGADQLLVLNNSRKADFKMRIFNADGSEVEMCGNGIRCFAKYIWDNHMKSYYQSLEIETLAGIIRPEKEGPLIRVDMGKPVLEPKKIPVKVKGAPKGKSHKSPIFNRQSSIIIDYPLRIKNRTFKITTVSMGNPHVVIPIKNLDTFSVSEYGPLIENHELFPKRTNVEFIDVINAKNIKMRVWERGVGETMACGTGASAAAVAAVLLGLTTRNVTVHLRGGKLLIEWSERDNHVYITGPAEKVFEGTITL